MIQRFKLIRRIVRAVNALPYAAARQINPLAIHPARSSAFDILLVVRGRAILLSVLEDDEEASDDLLAEHDRFQDIARATCAFISSVEDALRILQSVRREQIKLDAYAPKG